MSELTTSPLCFAPTDVYRSVLPNLGSPDVLGLQLPEILAGRGGGEGFWEW